VPKVQFKFATKATAQEMAALIAALRRHGASGVRALFPSDRDQELARLYIADAEDEAASLRLLALLKESTVVEYAEPEVRRKLIR